MRECLICGDWKESGTILALQLPPPFVCVECAARVLRAYGCHERANQLDGSTTERPYNIPDAEWLAARIQEWRAGAR